MGRIFKMVCSLFLSLVILETPIIAEEIPLDQTLKSKETFDMRSFFVGNVTRSYDLGQPYSYKSIDFTDYIDDNSKTIKSVTDELSWDYKNGLAKMDTANSQGATGFLSKARKIKLSDVIIECKNDFATILVISLDGKPISQSEKILIQSGQDDKLFGYREKALLDSSGNKTDRKEITSIGQYPYNVVKTSAVVTLKNTADVKKVIVLDENGYAREEWSRFLVSNNKDTLINLPADSMYTVVLRGKMADAYGVEKIAERSYREGYDYIWWEGENPDYMKNFDTSAFRPEDEFPETQHILSGGDWLTNDGDWTDKDTDDPPTAKYTIEVKEDASYSFFVRKFWFHGHFRWRFDDGKWNVVDGRITLLDYAFLKQFVGAYWVSAGEISLEKGKHVLEIQQMSREDKKAFGIDCFLLTQVPFSPRGLARPGEKSGKTDPGMWNFEPDVEAFKADNVIDLRYLNEEIAGQDGYLKQKDGKIYLGNGEQVRLWGINIVPSSIFNADQNSLNYFARLMAKYGVNYVRIHGRPWDYDFKISEENLNKLQYFINQLKLNGIYSKLSLYFVLSNDLTRSDQFKHTGEIGPDGYIGFLDHNKEGYSYIIWNEELQQVYFEALKRLLTADNPYTGVPLIKEPALSVIEIQNEDSMFFSTFGSWRWPDADRVKFNLLFGEWLVNKYGSISKVLRAWGDVGDITLPNYVDDYKRGAFDIQNVNDFLGMGTANMLQRRRADVYQFMLETQYNFYKKADSFIKDELGFDGLTVASNWLTVDARRMDAAERYTYLPSDITDRHGYADNVVHSTERSYEVNSGDRLHETPAILHPPRMPVLIVNTKGQASSISEINWINPSSYKVDEPYFLAAYSALQGIDMFNVFQVSSLNWETGYTKWSEAVPSRMGQWSGFALAFRRGDIKEAQVVALENIDKELLETLPLHGSKIYNGVNMDDFRKNN